MELKKIRGRTYYIPGATNVGVYRYRNGLCTLVDTGINNTAGRKIIELLEDNNLKIKYIINTHAHPDHFGANNFIKEKYPGVQILTSYKEKLFMENSFLEQTVLYGAAAMPGLSARILKAQDTAVDLVVDEGITELDNKKFEIVSLEGHSIGQIGVATEDSVLFCGDAFFSEDKMDKYPFPFVFDLEAHLKTLEFLLGSNYECYMISHCDGPLDNPKPLIQKNIDNINHNLEIILDYLSQPLTREDLTELIIKKYDIDMNLSQYFITISSVGAFLTYLLEKQSINMDIIDGKMYFYV
ncbi:MAG: MBL fold metallo-hydrolase [Tepidanaerobacteraceae bacterium]|jgi:glyoxylase-like metal-dependent hydrolase (beta-lactamase superfamily II)